MQLGRFGSLVGFAVQVIGAGVALSHPEIGYILIAIGTAVLFATIGHIMYSHRSKISEWRRRVGFAQTVLLVGIVRTWLFLTVVCGSAAWMVWSGEVSAKPSNPVQNERPLAWVDALSVDGGPLSRTNVFAYRFRGKNISQREVKLKNGYLVSAVNGVTTPLRVVAESQIVPIDEIELIPPGAPIELLALFGPTDPANPPRVLGLEPKTFLETWRQFSFNVEDDTRKYRINFNEGNIAFAFPGTVGPHVSKKVTGGETKK
jgi:hypothetical protein